MDAGPGGKPVHILGGETDDVNHFENKLDGGEFFQAETSSGVPILYRTWRRNGSLGDVPHKKGDRMRTWQVMQELGLHSYRMSKNPLYTVRAV